ncbi:MAG: ABC transporter permease [Chloroflexi bacterium]|jgi:ABC-2 type transport system permease protein|nr:ABC transporter permease [Chloroflexota bacterium]
MRIKRALAITKRIFRGLRHDRRTVALIILAPVLAMTLFGIAFSGEVEDVDVIVVDHDGSDLSNTIIGNLDEQTLNIRFMDSEQEAVKKVEDGNAWAVFVFPEDFSQNIATKNAVIHLRGDKSNVNVASAIATTLREAMTETLTQAGGEMPVSVSESPVYGEDAEFIDFFVPGIMAFAIFLLTTLLTLLAFVGERTSGTLERLKASPMRDGEIVLGYVIAFGVIGMVQAFLLLIIATVGFNITIEGNPFLAYIIVALLALVSVNLGILLSAAAKREAQAVQFLPMIILPTFLLAGIFWPVEAIPSFLRWASFAIPPTYGVEAMRSVMVRGWGLGEIWMELVVLLAFALVFMILSVKSLQRGKG